MVKKITKLEVDAFDKRGRLLVSEGLYLQVSKWGTKSWEFRFTLYGRTRSMGLGPYPKLSLADARDKVKLLIADVAKGIDPIEVKQAKRVGAAKVTKAMTFAEAAAEYIKVTVNIDVEKGGFKNAKHRQQWQNTIETYANPIIGRISIADVNTNLVLKVLQQDVKVGDKAGTLWNMKTETASRLRGRIEKILAWAAFRGLRGKEDNPARWNGHLEIELRARNKAKQVKHHAALPYAEIGAFMAELRKREGSAARALEFSILTAARSGEARGATWAEIDLKEKLWKVPKDRMKADKFHEIPLTAEMLALLEALPREEGNPLVFIGTAKTGGLSENALTNVLGSMGRADLTQHGFRSTFREWAGNETAHPREVIEHALAHGLKDKAEAAYQRGTLLPKRRRLMADWGRYCGIVREPASEAGGTVVALRGAAS